MGSEGVVDELHEGLRETRASFAAQAIKEGVWTEGRYTEMLERVLETTFGRPAVAVSSGTAALAAGLIAAGVREGQAVLVPEASFTASALAVTQVGAFPVFVSVNPRTGVVDWSDVLHVAERRRAAAIMTVSLDGVPVSLPPAGAPVPVVVDACAGWGSRMEDGTPLAPHGENYYVALSFNEAKHVPAGEGGALLCPTAADAEVARQAAYFGETDYKRQPRRSSSIRGFNGKMPEVTAAVARASLMFHDQLVARARENAQMIEDALSGCGWLRPLAPREGTHGYHKLRFRIERDGVDRTIMERLMTAAGINTFNHQDVAPLPSHPALRQFETIRSHHPAWDPERMIVFDKLSKRPNRVFEQTAELLQEGVRRW